jgi:hypothetical protein
MEMGCVSAHFHQTKVTGFGTINPTPGAENATTFTGTG